MKRFNDATVSATQPTPPAAGTEGFPNNGNPIGPIPATDVPDWWLSLVTEHARGQGDIAGITPSMTGWAEGAERLARVAGAKVTTISATRALTLADQGLVLVSAASANVALTLPAANIVAGLTLLDGTALPTVTPRYRILRTDSSSNTLTVSAPGGNTLDRVVALPPGAIADVWSNAASVWQAALLRGGLVGQSWTTAGTYTWTCPAGVYELEMLEVIGAGAGGGVSVNGSGAYTSGAGGGAGGWTRGRCAVVPGTAYTVTVGAGGVGGVPGSPATNGGTSSFGSIASATGGIAGTWPSTTTAAGGPGGTGTGLVQAGVGGYGGDGQSGSIYFPGYGGASILGGSSRASAGGGYAGAAPGAGGSGSYGGAGNGGAGAAGSVLLRYRLA